MTIDFDFGQRQRTKIDVNGVMYEVVNFKGIVLAVKGHDAPAESHDGKAGHIHGLELIVEPLIKSNGQNKTFVFHGPSPVKSHDYIAAGIILNDSPYRQIHEALYLSLYEHGLDETKEVRRDYKYNYHDNEADDERLGLEPVINHAPLYAHLEN